MTTDPVMSISPGGYRTVHLSPFRSYTELPPGVPSVTPATTVQVVHDANGREVGYVTGGLSSFTACKRLVEIDLRQAGRTFD